MPSVQLNDRLTELRVVRQFRGSPCSVVELAARHPRTSSMADLVIGSSSLSRLVWNLGMFVKRRTDFFTTRETSYTVQNEIHQMQVLLRGGCLFTIGSHWALQRFSSRENRGYKRGLNRGSSRNFRLDNGFPEFGCLQSLVMQ